MRRSLERPASALCALRRHVSISMLMVLAFCLPAAAQTGAAGEYQIYPLQYKGAADVEKMLTEMLSDLGSATHVVADVRANQILLRGPQKAHQIARQLIDSVDQPPTRKAPAKAIVKGYACPKHRLAELADRLRQRYGQDDNVRIATDPQTSQLLILAPPEVHAMIGRELGPVGVVQARGEPDPKALAEQIPGRQFVRPAYSPVERIESQLRTLLGSRLAPLANQPPGRPDYLFTDGAGRRVELTADVQGNGILVAGSQPLVRQFVLLIYALDALESPRREPDRSVRIVPVHRADPAKVRQAVDAYRSGTGVRRSDRPSGRTPPSGARVPATPDMGRTDRPGRGGVELAQYIVPMTAPGAEPSGAPGAEPNGAPGAQPIPTTEQELEEQRGRLRELGEEVEIETLPDLDVIILRGRERDIDEVSRIIAEIERLSAITEPIIDVYQLQHVSSEGLIEIIELVAEDVAGGRRGSVHITDLVKPNALLLVGWGEAMEAIKELIAKLDQPVAPQTQLRVFPLRSAPASSAGSTIDDFFSERSGLGPRVDVEPDVRTNCLIVRAAPRDMAEVEMLIRNLDRPDSQAVNQAQIFKLNNSLANDLAGVLQAAIEAARGDGDRKSAVLELLAADVEGQQILKSGLLSDVEIIPDPHTNTLIVSAPAESMDLLKALIERLDSPTAVAQIKVFEIVNGDANSLVEMLRSLLPSQAGVPGPQLAGAEGETTLVPVRFAVDIRTNSIIATGSEGDLAIIEALLLRLDAEEIEERKNSVYRLKNSPATDVAQAINQFLQSERAVELAAPGAESPFRQIEREVVVVPEPVTNSLIISATPRFYDEIEDLVQQLDQAPAQVMIQVLIAEVELNNIDEFGVELGLQDSILFDRSLLGDLIKTTRTIQQSTEQGIVTVTEDVVLSATNTPGFDFNTGTLPNSASDKAFARSGNVGGQSLTNFALGRMNSELGYGGLVLSASSESVSILIRALQETRRLDVLGRPQIMTLDNQPAYIQVGKAVPRIVGTRFDANVQVNQIDLEPTGLIMAVTPRVSPEGMVVMEIDAQKSELGPEAEGIPVSVVEGTVIRQPSINITMAQTTVSAANGETIVLGGLITKKDSTIHRRVPWLARVPVLGNLFRYDNESSRRAELLIILTPHVITSAEEAEQIKQIESARMSWCLADVHELHGPTGLYEDQDSSAWQGQGQVIYPDLNPRGLKPGEFVPQEVFPENLQLSPPLEETPQPAPSEGAGRSSPAGSFPPGFGPTRPGQRIAVVGARPGAAGNPAVAPVEQTSWTGDPRQPLGRYQLPQGPLPTGYSPSPGSRYPPDGTDFPRHVPFQPPDRWTQPELGYFPYEQR